MIPLFLAWATDGVVVPFTEIRDRCGVEMSLILELLNLGISNEGLE